MKQPRYADGNVGEYDGRLMGYRENRKELRAKGQFWTPAWVARAMAAYVLQGGAGSVFDPAVGAGAFFHAAASLKPGLSLVGMELDPHAISRAVDAGAGPALFKGVTIGDYLSSPSVSRQAIVANPPYIRHHLLPPGQKAALKLLSGTVLGAPLDGRAGLHAYFLVKALSELSPGGRLAFILPADVCEGRYAPSLWHWISGRFRLDGVVTFAPSSTPFPGVDVNPIVLFLRAASPGKAFPWARCSVQGEGFFNWVNAGFTGAHEGVTSAKRDVVEGVRTGLSRPPSRLAPGGVPLGEVARVVRGVATGNNAFFFLTRQRAQELRLTPEFLRPAIGRVRDVRGAVLSPAMMDAVDAAGRPTLLFAPDGRPLVDFPLGVRRYLAVGESLQLPGRPLLGTRNPWYKMEKRLPPPILFAYLGRRESRFIRNLADAVPLTGFLCVYPLESGVEAADRLWEALSSPGIPDALCAVGKSYGDGGIKVEPRALEEMAIPPS